MAPVPFVQKIYPFSTELLLHLCEKSVGFLLVSLFLGWTLFYWSISAVTYHSVWHHHIMVWVRCRNLISPYIPLLSPIYNCLKIFPLLGQGRMLGFPYFSTDNSTRGKIVTAWQDEIIAPYLVFSDTTIAWVGWAPYYSQLAGRLNYPLSLCCQRCGWGHCFLHGVWLQ